MTAKEKPTTFKRIVKQDDAIVLYNFISALPCSPQEKIHTSELQDSILELFPEAKAGGKAQGKRTMEINRRQMNAIIYGILAVLNNLEAKAAQLNYIWGPPADHFAAIKELCKKYAIWDPIVKILKPETAKEWEDELDEMMDIPEKIGEPEIPPGPAALPPFPEPSEFETKEPK